MSKILSRLTIWAIALFVSTICLGPAALGLVDLASWLMIGSQLTSLDWNDSWRAGVAALLFLLGGLPSAALLATAADE